MVLISHLVAARMICVSPSIKVGVAYEFIPSKTPPKSRELARTIFGQSPLTLAPNGEFFYALDRQSGFWRREGRKIVLVHRGFFDLQFLEPDALLKTKWPKNELEGLVLKIEADGSLSLQNYPSIQGAIVFREYPKKSTLQLIKDSLVEPSNIADYLVLRNEGTARFQEIVSVIVDPKRTPQERRWAAIMLPGSLTDDQSKRLIGIIENFPDKALSDMNRKAIRKIIAIALLKEPSENTFDFVFSRRSSLGIADYHVVDCLARNCVPSRLFRLETYLNQSSATQLVQACDAARKARYRSALPRLRELVSHTEIEVRLSVMAAVLVLSESKIEKLETMAKLQKLWGQTQFGNSTIVAAWKDCGLREAVGYLAWALKETADEFGRRDAALALGELGYPEAVPILLEVKNSAGSVNVRSNLRDKEQAKMGLLLSITQDNRVRKAAVEALWMFDKKAKIRKNKSWWRIGDSNP